MTITSSRIAIRTALVAVASGLLWAGAATAYEQYSENADATNCRECHGDFRAGGYISRSDDDPWPDSLHNVHRNVMLDGDCDTCHSAGGRFPVFLNSSTGGEGFPPVACVGCHGIDPTPGTPNSNWGAGLRRHHTNAGVPADQNGDTCVSCHPSDPLPVPEFFLPAYYFTPDPAHPDKPTDSCNPSPGFPEHFSQGTMGTQGLDNDGDLVYDMADSDCASLVFIDGFESGNTAAWSGSVP